jgi:hypothetical protein
MTNQIQRVTLGALKMSDAFLREPAFMADLPRWVKDARIRKDPLAFRRPWWNYNAIKYVEACLPQEARVFEFGGGASTLWLIDKGARVTTIEDNRDWYDGLIAKTPNADIRFIPRNSGGDHDYVHAIDAERDESLDLVIVDGEPDRVPCVLAAITKIRHGGMLLLDDTQFSDHRPPARHDVTRLRDQYVEVAERLSDWPVVHCRGIKPGTWLPIQTTVWTKPRVDHAPDFEPG